MLYKKSHKSKSESNQVLPGQYYTRKRQITKKGGAQSYWPKSGENWIWQQGCRVDTVFLAKAASHTEKGGSYVGNSYVSQN
jgi:hypothetical protein